MTPEALQRQTRAYVARALLRLHQQGQLENPEHWTWDQLSLMPRWCLYAAEERMQLQRVCGAVVMAPSMARWIDGKLIRAAHELVGASLLESLLQEAWEYDEVETLADIRTGQPSQDIQTPAHPTSTEVDAYLLNAGAGVLRASLDPSLPVDRLAESLPMSVMSMDRELARAILDRAQSLLATFADQVPEEAVA